MIKERINKLKKKLNFKIIYIVICLVFLMGLLYFNTTHAYYSSETGPIPIFTSKVGNFAGKGDTSPLDRPSDINVLYLVQDITNPRNYTIMEVPPVVVSRYIINDKKSNCIPKDGKYEMNGDKTYSIKEDGEVTIKVSQDKPNQIVCRIYYDYEKDLTKDDVIVFALIEDELGMVIYNDKHYTMIEEIPISGYTYNSSSCNNTNNVKTELSYDTEKGFTFKTEGKNICYAYFNKIS